jgi:hypothetical protein
VHNAPATVSDSEIVVASKEELHAALLNGKRLLALWNALPGVDRKRKVGDREALIDQLWSAIEMLPDPESGPDPERPSKQDVVIAMLRQPEGATVDEVASMTGWQRHTVRGVFSGTLRAQESEANETANVAPGNAVTLGQLVERSGAAGGELLKPRARPRNRLDQRAGSHLDLCLCGANPGRTNLVSAPRRVKAAVAVSSTALSLAASDAGDGISPPNYAPRRSLMMIVFSSTTTLSESAFGLTNLQKVGSFPGPLVFYRVCKQDSFFREMKWQLNAAGQANPVTAQMRVPGAL